MVSAEDRVGVDALSAGTGVRAVAAACFGQDAGAATETDRQKCYNDARRAVLDAFRGSALPAFRTFVFHYVLTVLPIAVSIVLCVYYPAVWTYGLAALTAAVAQNGLGLLMHEGSHGFFHADRRLNDLVANVMVCLPIFNTVDGYRVPHLDHHRYAGEARDPYAALYAEYRGRGHVLLCLLGDLFLVGAMVKFGARYFRGSSPRSEARGPWWVLPLVGTHVSLFALYTLATGWWGAYFVLWLLPLMTIPQFINRLRTIAEHTPAARGEGANRSTAVGWLEYLLIAPYGYAFHFEHHLAPTIPYYHLSSAHQLLSDSGFVFSGRELTGGYIRKFLQLMQSLEAAS